MLVWVWADSRLPFDDSEGFDDFEDEEEDYEGDYNASDDGETIDLYDEELGDISKCIKKSIEDNILPKRQYLKAITQDQYDKIIGKDSYAFLHGHEDEIIATLTVGKEVSDDFKTLSAIDVREVYWIIISNLEKMGWSSETMKEELMDKFPTLKEYEAKRIIRTEVTRIINYAKEFIAERDDLTEYNYMWIGPLDSRTTPMCYYLQTGELRDSDKKLLNKLGHSESDLPPIPEDGMPLEDLRETCRKVAEAFGEDMISDWVMHINCRHTFIRGKRIEPKEVPFDEVVQTVEELQQLEPESEEPVIELTPIVEDDKIYIPVFDNLDTFIFINSLNGYPTIYDNQQTDDIFVFEEMDEYEVASWSRLIVQLKDEGLNESVIVWALEDTGNLEDDVIIYLMLNAEKILARAENEGWLN